MTAAQQLLNKFRAQAAAAASTQPASKTKAPIAAAADQAKIRAHIQTSCPAWLLAFYDLSLATGWRTADCCALKFSDIDFKLGVASIVVAKQTKQAQARALNKALEQARNTRKKTALAANDSRAYMVWDSATKDQIAADMTAQEQAQAAQAVANAKRKADQKALPAQLLKQFEQMRAAAADKGGFIFSSNLTASNRGSAAGNISRVTIWSKFKDIFSAVAAQIEAAAEKLSAYSLRKTFAVNLLKISGRLDVVMAAFGHSSIDITKRYLNLNSEAEKYQEQLIRQ